MSKFKRFSMGEDGLPEKKKRWSLFRSRTPDNILSQVVASGAVDKAPNVEESTTPSRTLTVSPSPLPSTSSEGSVPRSGSVCSSVMTFEVPPLRNRAASSLGRVEENERAPLPHLETDADGLPTYASATHPSVATTYRFTRTSPFAMVMEPEGAGIEHGLYHISVGVNIWIPSCTVTTVRRGPAEDGPMIAQLELGISSTPATILTGDICRPVNQIFFRKSSTSSTRLYFIGDGTAIKWKVGTNLWQAQAGTTLLATFVPLPPRKLTLQPVGYRLSDHVVTSLVILMREHLTPLAGMRGDAAQLFNYSPHYNYQED